MSDLQSFQKYLTDSENCMSCFSDHLQWPEDATEMRWSINRGEPPTDLNTFLDSAFADIRSKIDQEYQRRLTTHNATLQSELDEAKKKTATLAQKLEETAEELETMTANLQDTVTLVGGNPDEDAFITIRKKYTEQNLQLKRAAPTQEISKLKTDIIEEKKKTALVTQKLEKTTDELKRVTEMLDDIVILHGGMPGDNAFATIQKKYAERTHMLERAAEVQDALMREIARLRAKLSYYMEF